ncbi:MAG: phage tail tape measure protein, partial [Microvirga sp.]
SRTLVNASLRAAMKPLRSGLTTLFKSALASGDGDATALAKGGVIARGQVMPFAKGGVVAAPTYFPLARGMGLMGEAGTEAVMPLTRGPDGRLGVSAAGASARPVQVTVNIATPDADSFRRSEAQVAAALARAVARGQRGL